jgi:Capsule assembly protein Wzi
MVADGRADPWLEAGDSRVRSDLQLLSDRGAIRIPLLTWPVSWPDVVAALADLDGRNLDEAAFFALQRIETRATREARTGELRLAGRLAGADKPTALRTFEDSPREQGELELDASYMGQRIAWRAAGTVVADPSDGQTVRPDGSYFGVVLGNWIVSAGYLDRWWGPGWEGSLILSNNARPIPSLAIERKQSDPFAMPWLSWLGPWRLSFQLGQLEGHREDFDHPAFFALRIDARPLESLEVGISRSAQFCGEGRPCSFDDFWNLFWGRDNDQPRDEQPGNQLAGFDARWRLPQSWLPLAVYGQLIGEDEAGFLPSKYLGLFGIESWGAVGAHGWRAHLEYADTTCNFTRSEPDYGCAYNNVIYSDGYTYRDRSIGHAMGGDSRMVSLGVDVVTAAGNLWSATVRRVDLNRRGESTSHPITAVPLKLVNAEMAATRDYDFGTIRAGIGYDSYDSPPQGYDDEIRGYLEWRKEF